MDLTTSLLVLAWIAIALLAFAVAGLLGQVRDLRSSGTSIAPVGPAVGMPAPPIAGVPYEKRAILIFADEGCPTCEVILPEVVALARTASEQFVALFKETAKPLQGVLTLSDQEEAFSAFDVRLTPFAVAIDPMGNVVRAAPLGSRADFDHFVAPLIDQRGRGAA